jgi:hypothetical protein
VVGISARIRLMFSTVADEGEQSCRQQAQNGGVPKHMNVASLCWGFMRHLCREQDERGVGSGRQ